MFVEDRETSNLNSHIKELLLESLSLDLDDGLLRLFLKYFLLNLIENLGELLFEIVIFLEIFLEPFNVKVWLIHYDLLLVFIIIVFA